MSDTVLQDTLVLLKPDAVARRLTGQLISRLEDKEIDIIAMKMLLINMELAEQLYVQHEGKYFYPRLLRFITSGPAVAMTCRGRRAIDRIRQLAGEADPDAAQPGTIRGDFSCHQTYNLIHASDSPAAAAREILLFFPARELLPQLTPQFPWHSYPELTES